MDVLLLDGSDDQKGKLKNHLCMVWREIADADLTA